MKSSPSRAFAISIVLAALALCAGCSQFEHDWDAAAAMKPATSTDITGRWQGTWTSDGGHTGGLRCLMTRLNATTYHARYAATYWGILHFSYDMDLTAEQEAEWVKFQGSADLGAMAGGVYQYDGHANADNFYCNYHSSQDQGKFTMTRP